MLLQKYHTDLIIAGLIFILGFASAFFTWRTQFTGSYRPMSAYQQRLPIIQARIETVTQHLEAIERQLADNKGEKEGSSRQMEQIRREIHRLIQLIKN